MIARNIVELSEYFGTTPEHVKRSLYKYTDCGAWIDWNEEEGWVRIGSIVEGSDAEFYETFNFPLDTQLVDDWLDELEMLTDEAWMEANGGDDDAMDF